ncbi:Gag polyprotein [Fusarium oxysporum f. sp. albedinis]|nr:Gag polyprotein [Fusarium oxysporum f. sp. albedinis]
MKMNILLAQLLSYVLLAHCAQSTLSETCAGLQNLSTCKFKFSVPTGFTVNTKEVTEKKLNKCKTKKKEKKPCATKKEPSKTCDVMTCVSGYDITTKRVPTGLKVVTKQVDLCQTVRNVLGQSEGDNFIKSSEAICKCFPRLQQLSLTTQAKSISQGVISKANAKVADEIPGLETASFLFLILLVLLTDSNSVCGTEMDVPTYAKIITGMKSCEKGSCNSTQIIEAVQYVFSRFRNDIEGGFRGVLSNWGILTSMNATSVEQRDALSNLMSYVSLAQAQVESINASCEKLGSCKGPAVSSFMEQVNSNIAAASYLGNLRFPADLGGKLNNLLQRQANAYSQARDLLDEAATVALFKNGKVKTVKDLFQLLPMAKRVKDLSNNIKTQLDPFKEFLPNNLTFAISTAKEENKLRSMSFDEIELELNVSEKEENHEVLEKLEAMQELIFKNYNGNYLSRVISSIGSIQGQLSYLSAMNGKFIIETDIVSFEQLSKLPTMAMPCSKTVDKTYKDSGFKKVFSYPEYSKCTVDGMTAKFPDLQIGYFRWSF